MTTNEDGTLTSDVDYFFDIPVDLAAEQTGYCHDRWEFDWGEPRFAVLQRAR
jgi:hypothetical protein